jgi:hypothetical protein
MRDLLNFRIFLQWENTWTGGAAESTLDQQAARTLVVAALRRRAVHER